MKIFDVLRTTALSWFGRALMPDYSKKQLKRRKTSPEDYKRIASAQEKRLRKQARRANENRNQTA